MKDQTDNILNKFTYHFKRVLINAQNLALAKKNEEIQPEDLLSSLFTTKGALGSDILIKHKVKINFDQPDQQIDFEIVSSTNPSQLPQPSATAQRVIERAVITAYKFQHKYVGTEHLLYGFIDITDDSIASILQKANINAHNLKQHLNLILKSNNKFNDLSAEENSVKELENIFEENGAEPNPLDIYTINLTSAEIQKDIDPVIGRQKELDRLIEILARRTKNNPVLLGDAGVGKTAIIEGLAKRIMEGQVPDVLLNKTILNLDLSALIAGTMYRGEFENRLKQVINEVKNNPNIIIFIDELHTIMGAGATAGSMDAANILKPALARGHLRCIGATTFEEYKKHIETDRALERRFQSIIINESSQAETLAILKGLKNNYEKFHHVSISDDALEAAVTLSQRFLPDKKLPDKAIDLIDEAAARMKVRQTKRSLAKEIRHLEEQAQNCQNNKRQAILVEDYLSALNYRDQEDQILTKLLELQAQEDKQRQSRLGEISSKDVVEIISEMTHVPIGDLTASDQKNLIDLEQKISRQVFGQENALQTIAQTIRQAKAGLTDKNKPLASFMFLGPSGVGKTETAKQIANFVFGGSHNLLRIDMSEFSESFNISKLIGSPAGYVGYREGNKLTDTIKNKPYTLILFDEIEKAHPDIFNLLLPILEEGELTDATGRTVNFRNCVIVMTSNVGLPQFNHEAVMGFDLGPENTKFKNVSNKILSNLSKHFPPEFINRLSGVVVFDPLDKKAASKIIKQEIKKISQVLKNQTVTLTIPTSVENKLLSMAPDYIQGGARGLKKIIDQELTNPISKILLTKKTKNIKASLIKEKIILR
ncbi:MAG: ATP-dependent Clp protease ATP-binding subunit ClpC [Patescibacteria group bacterium]|nr:ATP-dependent Clp protease ATP-binding subunit ClpC [Patescibacteria group bacterium]